ncbi:MAG: caspase family protein [Pseudomonadota bacterium]
MARITGILRCLAALVSAILASPAVASEPRIALVVGNSAYATVSSLDNPGPDAQLIATTLEGAGFEVTLLKDATRITLVRAIAQFGRDLRAAGEEATGLFYYAGHGVQSFGSNFLLPVDVSLTDAADLDLVAVEAQAVLRQMASARNRTNIVILDACRDNPFETVPDLNSSGLAEMKAPTGTFLAYATAPGAVALDGTEGNSPFTAALAERMSEPGLPIEQLFKDVRVSVLETTGGAQVPWDTSSLTGDFSFVEKTEVPPADFGEAQIWSSVQESGDPLQVLLFLRGHPDGTYAAEARALLTELMAAETANPILATPTRPAAPAASEQDMITAARVSGNRADYEAYLASYPNGTYAELARFEIGVLDQRAATATPAGPPAFAVGEVVTYDAPIPGNLEGLSGRTIAELIAGTPEFPPIDGLPEPVWKDKTCATCHTWTREALCTQGNTYLAESASRSLMKAHPYGGGFKRTLKNWANGGCE